MARFADFVLSPDLRPALWIFPGAGFSFPKLFDNAVHGFKFEPMSSFISTLAKDHFGIRIVRKLAKKGIFLHDIQSLPDMNNPMPFANATTAYVLNDNGTARVRIFSEVIALANA